jgi:hypothetical protein
MINIAEDCAVGEIIEAILTIFVDIGKRFHIIGKK